MSYYHDIGIVFFAALVISVLATPMSARLASIVGAIDHPDGDRKHHGRAVPRLGGIGITLAFMIPPLVLLPLDRILVGIMVGAAIIAITGLLDDLLQLRAIVKLVAQFVAAACFVLVSGASLTSFGNLFGFGPIETGSLAPWITVFCIVGVINAMNLCDGLDGLAAGFAIIACIFLSMLAYVHHDWFCLMLLLALMGGSLGFLRYNTQPAHLFMGDIGSMMLGYGLATMAVLLVNCHAQAPASIAPITIATILALPILDTLVVMIRRMLRGKMPFSPDRTHLHHRLLALGLPYDQTVMLLYVGMMLFGCLALVVQSLPDWQQLISGLIVVFILFASLFAFERTQPRLYNLREIQLVQTITSFSKRPSGWLQRNTRPCALTTLTFIAAAAMLSPPPHIAGITLLYAVLISALVLYPWHPEREHAAVQKGIVYLMLAALFLSVQTSAPSWVQDYLAVLSVVALGIVLVRAVSWNADTHGSSSFQVLVLLSMAIIPIVMLPLHGSESSEHVVLASLEAVPVAWMLNGYSVHIYQRNRRVTLVLIGLIALALLKSEIQHAGVLSRLLS